MTLFIDGDAFPNLLKPIILRAIEKRKLTTIIIANKKINIGKSSYISYEVVNQGANEADDEIINILEKDDLVITADIPLANRCISKMAHAIDHRGEIYTVDNIQQYLAIRNLMQNIRDSGEHTSGPSAFGAKDAQAFANSLNKFLQANMSQ